MRAHVKNNNGWKAYNNVYFLQFIVIYEFIHYILL